MTAGWKAAGRLAVLGEGRAAQGGIEKTGEKQGWCPGTEQTREAKNRCGVGSLTKLALRHPRMPQGY